MNNGAFVSNKNRPRGAASTKPALREPSIIGKTCRIGLWYIFTAFDMSMVLSSDF